MTFSTILNVTYTLRSFRLVLEDKAVREIPVLRKVMFLNKISGNNFALPDSEENK